MLKFQDSYMYMYVQCTKNNFFSSSPITIGYTTHLLYNVNNDPITKVLRLLRPKRRNLHRFRERGFGESTKLAQYLVLRLKEDNLVQ